MAFEMVDARLHSSRTDGFDVLDTVDHQRSGSVVVEATAPRVVQRLSLRILGERFIFHARHQPVKFLAKEVHEALLHVARQAHGGEMRRDRGDVAAGVWFGDHVSGRGRATLQ